MTVIYIEHSLTSFLKYRAILLPCLFQLCLFSNFNQCIHVKIQINTIHLENLFVLFDNCILWLNQNLNQLAFGQIVQCRYNWQSSNQFRNHSKFNQMFWLIFLITEIGLDTPKSNFWIIINIIYNFIDFTKCPAKMNRIFFVLILLFLRLVLFICMNRNRYFRPFPVILAILAEHLHQKHLYRQKENLFFSVYLFHR